MIKKFLQYIKENDEFQDITSSSDSKYDEIKDEIKSMIESTIENSGGEFNTFVDSLLKNPEDVKIEGLINDSDIYDFYLKWRNDVDEILNDVKFFDESPVESNAFGLYAYTIKGTERSIEEVIKMF